eukprot:5511757-Prymnesium_polylepis.1
MQSRYRTARRLHCASALPSRVRRSNVPRRVMRCDAVLTRGALPKLALAQLSHSSRTVVPTTQGAHKKHESSVE